MLSITYAKYIFSYLFFMWKMFPITNHIWSMNFEKQWKVIPLTIVSFLFWHMIPSYYTYYTQKLLYFKISWSCYLCVPGDCLNPPLPSRTSLPPTLVIWLAARTKAHPAPPSSGAAAANNSIIPMATVVIVDVPLVKWFHPPTPVPVVSPTTHEGASRPQTTCKQTKYFYMDHPR